ncbi:hypothetical protein [Streptomyces sp. NPDC046161]|uniref:hypothetical protein n=1 Tax=Streptomyces sp. NPDC046161 TaxID=3155132 RepID=UPI0033E0DE62
MTYQRPFQTRVVVVVVGVAALAATVVTPAQAAIPPAGTIFQISTVLDGRTMCVSNVKDGTNHAVYPLINCNTSDVTQQWRRTDNGRNIKNVGTGVCIHQSDLVARGCERERPSELIWKQDGQGRVWKPYGNSISRTYWANVNHVAGPRLRFPHRTNNTIPEDAAVYVFKEI